MDLTKLTPEEQTELSAMLRKYIKDEKTVQQVWNAYGQSATVAQLLPGLQTMTASEQISGGFVAELTKFDQAVLMRMNKSTASPAPKTSKPKSEKTPTEKANDKVAVSISPQDIVFSKKMADELDVEHWRPNAAGCKVFKLMRSMSDGFSLDDIDAEAKKSGSDIEGVNTSIIRTVFNYYKRWTLDKPEDELQGQRVGGHSWAYRLTTLDPEKKTFKLIPTALIGSVTV